MNWGKGLIIGMGTFMMFIIAMGIKMFMIPGDDYDHQYYEKGLNFNHDLQKEQRVIADHMTPAISQAGQELHLQFAAKPDGYLQLQRPSDQSLDKRIQLSADDHYAVRVPLNGLARGQWQLVLNWKANGGEYLFQREIFIK
ncbi:MAG TPA: FixH family protein [Mucilaginibacter sp.]